MTVQITFMAVMTSLPLIAVREHDLGQDECWCCMTCGTMSRSSKTWTQHLCQYHGLRSSLALADANMASGEMPNAGPNCRAAMNAAIILLKLKIVCNVQVLR